MGGGSLPLSLSSSPTSLSFPLNPNNISWIPLQTHPLFKTTNPVTIFKEAPKTNLVAYDAAASRLYVWDPRTFCIHRIRIRLSSEDDDDEGKETDMVMAENRSDILVPDVRIGSKDVSSIGINADGSCLFLCGADFVYFMILYNKISSVGNTITYRTSSIGSQLFSHSNGLQVLQVSWHPYSSNHLGILSSDSVLRLFDLSSDREHPEQEFYLQPFDHGSSKKAASICPVAFSFGDQHLWDRFSIFVLFSDGNTYVLCPVVPFGSLCKLMFLEELYEDVKEFGLKSTNTNVVRNSNLALDWLESTFLELANRSIDDAYKVVSRAQPYAPVDSSLTLQGPLRKVKNSKDQDDTGFNAADCIGKAVSFLYSSINKDSVLVTVYSSGQLQIDALADEILPVWNIGSSPRLRVDSHSHIKGVAMICESNSQENSIDQGPPLLRLATVDLALPKNALDNSSFALYQDPLLSERFYCLHSAGIDSISIHYLPFSNLLEKPDKIVKEPSVFPIFSTSHGESLSKLSICGFAAMANTRGSSWIVGITSNFECVVLESKALVDAAPYCDMDAIESDSSVNRDEISGVISKELLSGPKAVGSPSIANLRTLTADSIEGRSALHHYIKLFHENYVKYAHKVFIELEHHEKHTKMVINNLNERINEAKKTLLDVETKEQGIRDRIERANKVYELLEERLRNFRMLPGARMKPLSRSEHQFKAQLDQFADVELDALHSSIDALNARLRRTIKSCPPITAMNVKGRSPLRRTNQVSDNQIEKIRSSLQMLAVINSENTKKVDLIEHGLKKVAD